MAQTTTNARFSSVGRSCGGHGVDSGHDIAEKQGKIRPITRKKKKSKEHATPQAENENNLTNLQEESERLVRGQENKMTDLPSDVPNGSADLTNGTTEQENNEKNMRENSPVRQESRPTSSAQSASRPGSTRRDSRYQLQRAQSRSSVGSASQGRRTINRSGRKSRPNSTGAPARDGKKGVDSESDNEDAQTHIASDIDFGGADIYADSGWDTDLEIEEVKDTFDGTGKAIYVEMCKKCNVIPASYFLRHMHDTELEMKHHGLGPQGIKPLAVSLVSNTTVLKLNLADNWLGMTGGVAICEMLKENCYITDLDLSDNRLGPDFAEPFIAVLSNNSTLTHITLAGNQLDDKAAVFLAEAIMNTSKIEYLNLSRNNFGEKAGIAFGPAIAENSSIKHMDLSWNSIRRKGAIEIAKGVKQNVLMQKLDLSWNGFGNDGAQAVGDALKANSSLEELNISNNRIATEGAVLLGKGLVANDMLKVLLMGKNPMQSAGCYGICAAILKNPNCLLRQIDFSDILVNNDFLDVYKQVKEQLPDLKLRHGGDGLPKKPKARVHPMNKLKNYVEKNNLRLIDFFNRFDKDHSMSVTREEFTQGLETLCKESGIKLTDEEVTILLDELDKDGDGEINYSELVIGHQDFTEKEKKMSTTISAFRDKCEK